MLKLKSFILVLIISVLSLARVSNASILANEIPYYGSDFYKEVKAGIANEELLQRLKTILRGVHQTFSVTYDQISDSCKIKGCYKHISLGYDKARTFMMGTYYLVNDSEHGYGVHDVYCGNTKYADIFKNNPPAPNQIPDGTILNTEHTWPQSKFTRKYDQEMQKSDIHHLFPTDSQINAIRGNNSFGEVAQDSKKLKCPSSRIGKTASGRGEVFQPPAAHRGNVARAIFYFSVRYDLPVDAEQEATLRKWNHEDPVDEEESRRNEEIMKIQGNRNPFIDFPVLVDRIQNF